VLDRPDHIAPSPADRARAALIDDPSRSSAEIALAVRSTPRIVTSARAQLASLGLIPASPFPRRAPPRLRAFPRPPRDLMQGSCVGHPDPGLWTDPATPADRELARHICRFACPVTASCFEWAIAALPVDDRAIYAATTAGDRERIRAERAGRPVPLRLTTAGKNAARQRRRHPPPGQQEARPA
jgi:Transcription factor WhiB